MRSTRKAADRCSSVRARTDRMLATFAFGECARAPLGYHRGMDSNASPSFWKVLFGGACITSILLGLFIAPFFTGGSGGDLCIMGGFGLLGGPFLIWQLVRLLNDRDDPRQQKRPPDAP